MTVMSTSLPNTTSIREAEIQAATRAMAAAIVVGATGVVETAVVETDDA